MSALLSAIPALIILVIIVTVFFQAMKTGGASTEKTVWKIGSGLKEKKNDMFLKYLHSVTAEIINYDESKGKFYPIYRYTYNGRTFQTQAKNALTRKPKSGKNVELLVNPDDPNDIYEVYRYPIKH